MSLDLQHSEIYRQFLFYHSILLQPTTAFGSRLLVFENANGRATIEVWNEIQF